MNVKNTTEKHITELQKIKYKKVNKVLIFEVVLTWNRFLKRNLSLS
jgi:hypothetical protein